MLRVGVYVDGFNLYYGAGDQMGGRHVSGWKWLDLRKLAARFVDWHGAEITRVVYCTAQVTDEDSPGTVQRQQYYLAALEASGSVDIVELGYFNSFAKEMPLVDSGPGQRNPRLLIDSQRRFRWSHELRLRHKKNDAITGVVRKREEKGSDVNVATHLLVDVLTGKVDAAVVISNDSDLAMPISVARQHVPVGLVNPQTSRLAGALKGNRNDGVGRHRWAKMTSTDLTESQLPDPVMKGSSPIHKPSSW